MTKNTIMVNVTIPRAIGESTSFTLEINSTVLSVIEKLNQPVLKDKIMRNDYEFNQFSLIYVNDRRIKDSQIQLTSDTDIEIIIPMAGG